MADYKKALAKAPAWRDALESKLKEANTVDEIRLSYECIAKAFPSECGHSLTFDINIIKHEDLQVWAKERGGMRNKSQANSVTSFSAK